jgi:hypothetical protein
LERKWEPPSDFFFSNERHAYLLAVSNLARINQLRNSNYHS